MAVCPREERMLKRLIWLAAAGTLLVLPAAAQDAASYPSRPVRIIVTVPAGGGVDTVTRIFADRLQRRLGSPFVIENQGGAGGNVGAGTVYGAQPDGYTLMSSQPAPLTTKMVHVPYKGTAPALTDLLAGQIDLIFMELSQATKMHNSGNARILAVATDKRVDSLPTIPTMIETGVPDFVSDTWNAISAPPKTPAAIVNKLNQAVNAVIATPEVKKQFEDLDLLPAG